MTQTQDQVTLNTHLRKIIFDLEGAANYAENFLEDKELIDKVIHSLADVIMVVADQVK